jgi:hypothetical protein
MRHDVKLARTSELPLSDLRPVLIPSPILAKGRWVGPYHYFPELPVSLTWAFLRPHRTMLYLSEDVAASLDQQTADWRRKAREAFTKDFRVKPWTHVFRGASGTTEAVALMHDDGLGPSRLLGAREFLAQFPGGFTFFVPERSCAVVLAATASPDVVAKVEHVVEKCFDAADVPMSKSGFRHEVLIGALTEAGEL